MSRYTEAEVREALERLYGLSVPVRGFPAPNVPEPTPAPAWVQQLLS